MGAATLWRSRPSAAVSLSGEGAMLQQLLYERGPFPRGQLGAAPAGHQATFLASRAKNRHLCPGMDGEEGGDASERSG